VQEMTESRMARESEKDEKDKEVTKVEARETRVANGNGSEAQVAGSLEELERLQGASGPYRGPTAEELERILSEVNTDTSAKVHGVRTEYEPLFTWEYDSNRKAKLTRLYEKAKVSQWNAQTDIDWSIDVDQEKLAAEALISAQSQFGNADLSGTPFEKWGEKEWIQFQIESQNWVLSQFLHGEQGALICTAKVVETVPWIDAKYYGATQVVDEARHVEVFSKYLSDKLSGYYPINAHLRALLDDILRDSRWDMTFLGMQIMVEGLALAAFGFMHATTHEPLLKQILKYVMSDEARHVAFGVLSLQDFYSELTAAEIRERQEFAFEAAVRMRDRFALVEVWERLGLKPREVVPILMRSPDRASFQSFLFSKIVPNCKKLGLLDAGDGWLRQKFTEIGVIQFENWKDTEEEVDNFQIARGEKAIA
jgi:hypothetical protein